MEVIEIIFQPLNNNDFLIDNCILLARDSLIQPVCTIAYFIRDDCEAVPARSYMSLKLGELRTLVRTTDTQFTVFAKVGSITTVNYRVKIYDWLGNVVGLSTV
jgi:hypothetical protein